MATRTKQVRTPDRYLALVRRFPLRPLRSEEDLDAAIAVIDTLIDRERLEPEEKDYLDVLSDQVERYEAAHHPIRPLSDAEILRHLAGTRGVSQAELARAAGIAESTISEVIAGKRRLTRVQIGKLARSFGVEPAAFLFDG